jgi:hypothetical protein
MAGFTAPFIDLSRSHARFEADSRGRKGAGAGREAVVEGDEAGGCRGGGGLGVGGVEVAGGGEED